MYYSRILVALGVFPILVFSSSGDSDPRFTQCVTECLNQPCAPLTLALRLTRWSCTANCQYTCMHALTDETPPMQQYFGKWPFWRFAGMQEPASVAFSVLNFWVHFRGWMLVRRKLPASHPLRRYYVISAFVSMNAWVWSSVFHTRDTPITEKLDYFSAALAILYPLYSTVIRLFQLYPLSQQNRLVLQHQQPTQSSAYIVWTMTCMLAYIFHITYLTLSTHFDYSYNMTFNVVLGIIHNLLWLLYALPTKFRRFPYREKSYRPEYSHKAAIFVVLTTSAIGLELFDFEPLGRVLDAHSLWHLSTAPISMFWYAFLVQDASDEGWREHKL